MDLQQETWQPVSHITRARRDFSCAVLGNKVYVVGGHNGANPSVEILTVAGDDYSVADGPDLPGHVRTYGNTIVYKGVVYFIEVHGKVLKLKGDGSGWEDFKDIGEDVHRAVVTDEDALFNNKE